MFSRLINPSFVKKADLFGSGVTDTADSLVSTVIFLILKNYIIEIIDDINNS